jgi:site-specific DNA-methyltransferase (adenine-specific)
MKSIPFHPAASIFPMMDDASLQSLADDIRSHGLHEAIKTHDGSILDGRNRYRACELAGIEPKFEPANCNGSPATFVWSLNEKRRHLNPGQRAMAADKLAEQLAAEAKQRQKEGGRIGGLGGKEKVSPRLGEATSELALPNKHAGKAAHQAAKIAGVSRGYIEQAKAVRKADPVIAKKVETGELTLPQAAREVQREQKRQELADKATKADAKPSAADPAWKIINGDCLDELKKLDAGRFRLIFADPPYNIGIDYGGGEKADLLPGKEFVAWCEEWIEQCHRVLTPDGSLWLLIGDEYADYIAIALREAGFARRSWIKWYETFGVNCSNNFNRCSRHLFYCVKDEKRFVFNADAVSRPSDRQAKYGDKRADPGGKIWDNVWQIPRLVGTAKERIPDFPTQLPLDLLRPIVGCASDPGDSVLDPFNGSGSTGAACIELGRKYLGIEKSETFARLATLRLKGVDRA